MTDTANIVGRLREWRCAMQVGCDEAGICYAEAHGEPDRCPLAVRRAFMDGDGND